MPLFSMPHSLLPLHPKLLLSSIRLLPRPYFILLMSGGGITSSWVHLGGRGGHRGPMRLLQDAHSAGASLNSTGQEDQQQQKKDLKVPQCQTEESQHQGTQAKTSCHYYPKAKCSSAAGHQPAFISTPFFSEVKSKGKIHLHQSVTITTISSSSPALPPLAELRKDEAYLGEEPSSRWLQHSWSCLVGSAGGLESTAPTPQHSQP